VEELEAPRFAAYFALRRRADDRTRSRAAVASATILADC
jgi:hypothetical protein